MPNEMMLESTEIIGSVIKTISNDFDSEVKNNKEIAIEMIKTCEKNEDTYRRMLESNNYTFDEKREIRNWMEQEEIREMETDANRCKHDGECRAFYITLVAIAISSIVAIADPHLTMRISETFPMLIPKATKFITLT